MASAVDSRLAYARLSAVATASRLPTANRGSNNSYTTSWDTTLVTQKPQNDLTLARHRPSLAKSQRACRQSLAWGKRGRAKLARIYHRPINSNFLLKIIGHVPVLLGHFD